MTGGTGDIKPQILTAGTTTSAATTVYRTVQITLPVARIGFQKNRAQIVEILKVTFLSGVEANGDAVELFWSFLSTAQIRDSGGTSSTTTLVEDFDDPRVFAMVTKNILLSGAAGQLVDRFDQTVDLTDNNGNGILIATDNIFLTFSGVGQGTAVTGHVKILYRIVNVGIQEYVGIVQSQQ